MAEVFDITLNKINWKLEENIDPVINDTGLFAIDILLMLLEESVTIMDTDSINLRLTEIIKLINMQVISFLPKVKVVCVICKN